MPQVPNIVALHLHRWLGLGRVVIGAAALGLGFWGWQRYAPSVTWEALANNAFRTLQLLTFQFSRTAGSVDMELPWQLEIARFLLPVVALFESYRLVLGAIRSPARLAMVGLGRGHIVVVPGRNPAATALMHDVRESGVRSIVVSYNLRIDDRVRVAEYKDAGLVVLVADPYLQETWHQAHAARASLVVVAIGSDVENQNLIVMIADTLRHHRGRHGPMLVTALEDDLLAEQVDIALDHAARGSGLRYRRLSVPDEAARMLFLDPPLPTRKQIRADPSHIILLGAGFGARGVLRHALTLGQDAAAAGPRISVLASEKDLAAQPLLRRDAIPDFVADLRGIACDVSHGLPLEKLDALMGEAPAPVMACVCLADDAAVTAGIALARQATLRGWPDFTIAVHQYRQDHFINLLARERTGAGHARLRAFGLLPPGTLRRLQNERDDPLPRAVHEHYLEMLRRLNAAGGTAAAWDELPENLRHANRAAADHIAVKLAAIGCHIIAGHAPPFTFTDAEIDALARIEHRRWCGERLLRGWRLGERDNDRRLHPDLVPFEALTEEGREKDRDAVASLPEVVALAGLSIQRGAHGIPDAAHRARPWWLRTAKHPAHVDNHRVTV